VRVLFHEICCEKREEKHIKININLTEKLLKDKFLGQPQVKAFFSVSSRALLTVTGLEDKVLHCLINVKKLFVVNMIASAKT
jgi:hypothetical protein